jgi:RNA polymerase sigma factor (TIGR02999 family)
MPVVYDELRRIAARYVRGERPGRRCRRRRSSTRRSSGWRPNAAASSRTARTFLAIAALSMRQILVQRARARRAAKRGGAPQQVTLDDSRLPDAGAPAVDIEALDEALNRLAQLDPEQAHIVELRYFGGLTIEETAEEIGSSPATVKRQWAMARAWLKRALEP